MPVQLVLTLALIMLQKYKDADNGIEIEQMAGDTFAVKLTSNPSTGYSWVFDGGADFAQVGKSTYESSNVDSELIGAPATQIMQFKALKKGRHILTLYYTRIWDRKSNDKTYNLIINVK